MFAIIMALWAYQNTITSNAQSRNDDRMEIAMKLTTEHEIKIKMLENTLIEIRRDLKENNNMIREFLISRYGYVPNDPTTY